MIFIEDTPLLSRNRLLILFFAALVLLIFGAARHDVSEAEARLLWIVRDPQPLEPAAISDTARIMVANFREMLARAAVPELPLAAPLDVWTLAAGGTVFAARIGVILVLGVVALVAARILRRFSPSAPLVIALVLLAGGLISVITASAPLEALVADYRGLRTPETPVITAFGEDSPLGYHQARHDLRRGMAVNLGWRDFSAAELAQIVDNLGSGDIWLIGETTPQTAAIETAITASGRAAVWCGNAPDTLIRRYAHAGAPAC